MKRCLALLFVVLSVPLAVAEDGIPAKTLAEIKAATVFIKMETVRTASSGSGFVIQSDKDGVLVATNYHVVSTGSVNDGPVKKLDVVFRSGKAREEATYPAEVLASDWDRDLAVLRVKGVKDAPKPIDLAAKAEPTETMTVYAVGFPFGEALSTTDGNPAPTISKASVSSLREDDQGELAVVQLEGGVNPGNSGGPVLDTKGRLVGVAVAKVRNSNIGFAVPPNELTKMLQGRYRKTETWLAGTDGKVAELEFTLNFIDPHRKVTSATLRVVQTDDPLAKPRKGTEVPELTGGTTHEVKVAGERGKVKLKLPVAKQQFQVTFANEGRKDNRTTPSSLDVPALVRGAITSSGPSVPSRPSTPTAPIPKPVNPLPGGETTVGDLKVKSVQVSTEAERGRPGSRTGAADPCLTWTPDAKGFYALDHGAETVRRFSFPELKEEAKLVVGKDVSWLSMSKEGLVLTVNGDQEAWVLDPKTLKKGVSFPVNKALRVLSAAGLSVGYVIDTEESHSPGTLRLVDLKTGKKLKEYVAKDLGKDVALCTPILSADGKQLFTTDVSTTRLMQFAGSGESVNFVASCDGLLGGAFNQPVVSADGKLVAAPSGAGNQSIRGRKASGYSTFVFDANNLQEPLMELKTGAYPRTIGFDTRAGFIFAQNYQDQLIIHDRDGTKLKSYRLGEGGEPYQFLPHPDGWKLLVFVPGGLAGRAATVYAVEIPKKK
jgi:S1-C subfamily serine protease